MGAFSVPLKQAGCQTAGQAGNRPLLLLSIPQQAHTPVLQRPIFTKTGTFYVMPKADLKCLEQIFRAKVLAMLKALGKMRDEPIGPLLTWRHSGFNVHNGVRIRGSDEEGR